MENKGLTCCVTGHRPKGFPWDYSKTDSASHQEYLEAMACYIDQVIRKDGVVHFIAGGAIGADTDFAETVLDFRDHVYDHITLEIAVPCMGQEDRWSAEDKARYKSILDRADTVTVLSEHYTSFCMQKRNEYMVDHSDIVFAFWNENETKGGTVNTINYAKRKNKRLELFVLNQYT